MQNSLAQTGTISRLWPAGLLFLTLLFLLTLWGNNPIWTPFIVTVVLIFVCFLPAASFFHSGNSTPSISEAIIYTVIGLALLSLLSLTALRIHLPSEVAILPLGMVGIYYLIKNKASQIPRINSIKYDPGTLIVWALGILWCFSWVWQLLLMGEGDYPRVFFNVDTPYYLGQVHSLTRFDTFPPPSLFFSGESPGYHYGVQGMAAILARVSNIFPHSSLFLVVFPLLIISTFFAALEISKLFQPALPRWLCLVIILFVTRIPGGLLRYVAYYQKINLDFLFSKGAFGYGLPMLSTQFAIFAVFLIILCLYRINLRQNQLLLIFLTGSLSIFKSPWFLSVGLGIASYSIYCVLRRRDPTLFFCGLISLIWALLLMLILGSVGHIRLNFDPLHSFTIPGLVLLIANFAPFIGAALIAYLFSIRAQTERRFRFHWWFIIFPLIFMHFFTLVDLRPGAEGNTIDNIFQIQHIWIVIVPIFLLDFLASRWRGIQSFKSRYIVTFLILFIALPAITQRLYMSINLVLDESTGVQYTNNGSVAEALKTIPVNNTLTVTNDFDYPFEAGSRPLRQVQLPAIFGHQFYASLFDYERYNNSDRRLKEQRLLRLKSWNFEIDSIAKRQNWTHLLVKRSALHLDDIPLKLLFQNDNFQVYRF